MQRCAPHFLCAASKNVLAYFLLQKNVPADNRKNSRARQDVLSALDTMERCLQGSCSKERRLLVKLALVTASQMKVFQNDELNHLKGLLAKLDGVCELQRNIRAASDCSFLYWHRVVLPIYFARLIEERADLRRLKV
jgi:WASH complex subunit 7